jgi:eukaryotic-like serine/threonine-protein kinase
LAQQTAFGAGHVSHSWAATSVDLKTEAGRTFFQERLALLGRIGFLLSLAFFLLLVVAWPHYFAEKSRQQAGGVIDVILPLCRQGLFLAAWIACRRGRRSLPVLKAIDAGVPVLVCLNSATQVILSPGQIPGHEWAILLTLTNMLAARAVFVPSPPLRTLGIGIAASLPVAAASIVHHSSAAAAPGEATIVAISALVWCLCALAITTLASAVIYGLQEKVREVQQLGQYTLEEKLGEGGMGIVYQARHAMLRRPTAVKLLPAEKAGEESIRRFEREVQLTAELSHPNTVAIYDYGRTPDGVFYYAMEYLDGINLHSLVKEFGPQSPARVVHLLQQVAGALGEAHGIGLVHRDVKPANIVLCQRGGLHDVAKVVDFGLVRDLTGSDAPLTEPSLVAGTPLYLAPEAITTPDSVDARSDLYALGAVGYFLLTASHVFTGTTLAEVCRHHLYTRAEPPSDRLGRAVPASLETLVMDCLEKDPARRPQSAREIVDRLRACADAGEWGEVDARQWWMRNREELRPARGEEALETTDLTPTFSVSLSLGQAV